MLDCWKSLTMTHSSLIILSLILDLTVNRYLGNAQTTTVCKTLEDCPSTLTCLKGVCVNSCGLQVCGPNSQCNVLNHVPLCLCHPGFVFVDSSCQPAGPPPKCTKSVDCGQNRSCQDGKCVDPCVGACGIRAVCVVRRHTAVCSCPPGFTGDPLSGCRDDRSRICTKKLSIIRCQYTWKDGLSKCKAEGKDLATIETSFDQQNIETFLKKEGIYNAWIGLTYINGAWTWNRTGRSTRWGGFTNWKPSEPNRTRFSGSHVEGTEHRVVEGCVEVNAGDKFWENRKGNKEYQWNVLPCSDNGTSVPADLVNTFYRFPLCEYFECNVQVFYKVPL